ncbi:MAG TPA: hypothetical protein VHE81_03900 [Lacipirellulaceae bacterium]|nr:hypothetical protein [Lacipirellulaceae bacterium]
MCAVSGVSSAASPVYSAPQTSGAKPPVQTAPKPTPVPTSSGTDSDGDNDGSTGIDISG